MPRNPVININDAHEYDTVVDIDLTIIDPINPAAGVTNLYGSGTYIGGGIVLTAAHVINLNESGHPVRPNTVFGDGENTSTGPILLPGQGVTLLEGQPGETSFSAYSTQTSETIYSLGADPDGAAGT